MPHSPALALGTFIHAFVGRVTVWSPDRPKVKARGPLQIKRVAGLLLAAVIMYPINVGLASSTASASPPALPLASAAGGVSVNLIKDIVPGIASSDPTHLTAAGGKLFFLVANRLWVSDGTEAGTQPVLDAAGVGGQPSFSNPAQLTTVGGQLYFVAAPVDPELLGDRLWVTDGTPGGTQDVSTWTDLSVISQLTDVDSSLAYVREDCSPGSGACIELAFAGIYRTRGLGGVLPALSHLTNVNGTLFFVLRDTVLSNGQIHDRRQLWRGSAVVGDLPGGETNDPTGFTDVNGTLYFAANDGVHGWQLWRSDGALIEMVPAGPGLPTGGSYSDPTQLTNVNGQLYFVAQGIRGVGVWTIESGGDAREVFCNAPTTSCHGDPGPLAAVNGGLFFVWLWDFGHELWQVVDGTPWKVKTITPPQYLSAPAPSGLTDVNGTLFFAASDGVHGTELWSSDGTEAGTAMVADLMPGPGSSNPTEFTPVNGALFYASNDGVHGNELWRAVGNDLNLITPVSATADVNNADAPKTIDDPANDFTAAVTYWQAARDPEACITFDLGQERPIGGIRETAGPFPGNPFTLFGSTDGVNFVQVTSGTLTQNAFGEHFFALTPARFMKMCVQPTDAKGFGELADFRVLGPAVVDNTPPACVLTAVNVGPPKQVQITVQDTGSGLVSVAAETLVNASLSAPPFTQGTTSPVVVTATKINPALGAQVGLQVTDRNGNTAVCHVIVAAVLRITKGQSEAQTITGLPQAASKVFIANGNPGLVHLRVIVNGVEFKAKDLVAGEVRLLDVSSAMRVGNQNTITVAPLGKTGSSADVVIWDGG